MQLSVICPVYNEEKYVEKLIRFFLEALPHDKELILVDGGSTDNTVSTILRYPEQFPQVRLLHNPERIVPFALNLAIMNANADIIVRLDAHTKYSKDYFERIMETFANTDADIVGGPTRTAFESNFQEAVGIAISNPFGIGNSKVHDCNYRGYTDSVTFGAWKKKIFSKTGLFDTELKRNQDDEFHYRAKSAGFRIFQNPAIELFYYPRNSLKGLISQYYQYGLYKPLVLRKVKSEIKIRHLVPAIFVLYVITVLPVTAFFSWYIIPLFGYLALDLYFSFSAGKSIPVKCMQLYIYPAIHLSYGIGFLKGLFKVSKNAKTKSG